MTLTAVATPASSGSADPGLDVPVVLIVTADANLRAAAARVVGGEGYRVLTASHGGHAVLACMRERIDLLVAELCMEDMSGPALAARLRRHRPDLTTIYFAQPGTTECDGVLVRPFTSVDLLGRLASARAAILCAPTSTDV